MELKILYDILPIYIKERNRDNLVNWNGNQKAASECYFKCCLYLITSSYK
jgi:hypothetical protein